MILDLFSTGININNFNSASYRFRKLEKAMYLWSIFMKKIIAILILFSACSPTVYNSLWQAQPINANEKLTPSFIYYDNNGRLFYIVSNDMDNFYCFIKTTDLQTQRKILTSGIQLWIDTTGKKQQKTGVLFPFENQLKKINAELTSGTTPYDDENKRQLQDLSALKKKFSENRPKMMHLAGFKPPVAGIVSVENNFGIAVDISWDSTNTMNYKAIIPFKTFYKKNLSISDSAKIFGVAIDLNSVSMMESQVRPPGGVSFGMGMGSMGMGGLSIGMRQPMAAYPGGRSSGAYDNGCSIKMKIKLATRDPVH